MNIPSSCLSNPKLHFAGALTGSLLVLLCVSGPAQGQTWPGPSFREFSGVNQSGTGEPLYSTALSYNRHDISWSSLEPSRGTWDLTSLNNAGQEILTLQSKNVRLLPVLNYGVNWAADLSSRQWTYGNDKWTVAPGSGGTMILNHYNIPTGNLLSSDTLTDFSKFPPANVADWTAYVQQVVSYLHASPYNVSYFQVWNEAQEMSGFWVGSMDDYIQRFISPRHKPFTPRVARWSTEDGLFPDRSRSSSPYSIATTPGEASM